MKIVLLSGGASPEREISLRSGKAIYKALKELGYSVVLIDPALGDYQPSSEDEFFNYQINRERVSQKNYYKSFAHPAFTDCDLVFIALHGKWGEDGTVQSILDLMELKYTGSGVLASSIAIDKDLTKTIIKTVGIKTPNSILINKNDKIDFDEIIENISLPCIFKPNDQGSTIGFSLVQNQNEILPAYNEALKYSDEILIEKYIKGREITVAVLGNEALPIVEVKPKHLLYDYECKYTKGMTEYICPAEIDDSLTKEIQKQAVLAFNSIKCRGFARIDFILDENNIPYFLEVNTIPGMTDLSLVPMAAKVAEIDFNSLINKIINLSL